MKDICLNEIDNKDMSYFFTCGWYYMLSQIKSENIFEIIQMDKNDDYRIIKRNDDGEIIIITNNVYDYSDSAFFFGKKIRCRK